MAFMALILSNNTPRCDLYLLINVGMGCQRHS
jgi:hypothetical protein